MDDIIQEFVTETTESLAILDQELVRFEQNPEDSATLGNIFRLLHTIKGTCGFLGLPRLEKLAHAGEDVLNRYRDQSLQVSAEGVSRILKCIDSIRNLIAELATSGKEPAGSDEGQIAELRALLASKPQNNAGAASAIAASSSSLPETDAAYPVAQELLLEVEAALAADKAANEPENPAAAPQPKAESLPAVHAKSAVPTPAVAEPAKLEPLGDSGRNHPAQPIRVNVEVLENLMTLVSELVLTRNQLLQISRNDESSNYRDPIQRLTRITTDLQEGVMKTRMQPVGNAWTKLPRIVRDLSHEMGKRIALVMEGESTEMDRQVLELIRDPLTHMVRNSADHGLEMPSERVAAGKPDQGTIKLKAFHEGGHIVIQLTDDGRGLNTGRIREKIVEKGLASAADVAQMPDDEVNQYIMRAGFSTAAKVTNVSGRGVGMDVVKTNIEKIGGTIDFSSKQGAGTSFSLKIPLTLAIVPALIVYSAGERYAIPQTNIQEVVRANGRAQQRIETINGAPVLRLRKRLLPLVRLDHVLGLAPNAAKSGSEPRSFVVVVENRGRRFGVVVDSIDDSEEIVVKPVPSQFREVALYSGITILGDGSLILILDINALDSFLSAARDLDDGDSEHAVTEDKRQRMLLFKTANAGQKGVPLGEVERIEALSAKDIEFVQGEPVIQYRGRLMKIVAIEGDPGTPFNGRRPLLVFGRGESAIGLKIESILDVVDESFSIGMERKSPWSIGSGVVGGRATDIVDPSFFAAHSTPPHFEISPPS